MYLNLIKYIYFLSANWFFTCTGIFYSRSCSSVMYMVFQTFLSNQGCRDTCIAFLKFNIFYFHFFVVWFFCWSCNFHFLEKGVPGLPSVTDFYTYYIIYHLNYSINELGHSFQEIEVSLVTRMWCDCRIVLRRIRTCDRMQKMQKCKKCKNHILHFFAFLSSFPFPRSQRDHDSLSPTTQTKPIQKQK